MLKNTFFDKKNESIVVVFIICFCILFFHFTLPKYSYNNYTTETNWDILSYYLYLPLTFLHNDIGIKDYSYIQQLFDQYHFSTAFYQATPAENGNWVMIYTMGMAILYLPFFLIGHLWANLGGYPADGFSYPYQFCVSTGMMLYLIFGVFTLRKILLRFFNDRITSITLVLLLLGTNYFRESTDYNMGPHAILFTFYCLLTYYTIKWHEQPKGMHAFIVGVAVGFLTLIRPTELICILIPLLWNVYDKQSFKDKMVLLKKNKSHIIILLGSCILIGIPQMVYWKILTGSWLYNSYWNQYSFDITESHLIDILFSFRKGWFVYTPMIIFAFIGLFFLRKEKIRQSRWSVFTFITINIFLISHVPIWWNAGSFGQRFMVQSYAILAIPLGAYIQFISEKRLSIKMFFGLVCFLMLSLNLFQTWQFVRWILPGDGMTFAYYKKSFFKTSNITKEDQSLLMLQRTYNLNETFNNNELKYKKQPISYFNLDNFNTNPFDSLALDTTHALSGKNSYRLSTKSIYSPTLRTAYSHITKKDHAWIQFTVWYFPVYKMEENPVDVVIHFSHRGEVYGYRTFPIGKKNIYELGKWNKFTVQYLTPEIILSDTDLLTAYVLLKGEKPLYIDDIYIEAFEKRD